MRGYTLVELMVVISTIVVLSLIGIIGIRGASDREELAAASRQLVGDLISTQNKASSGKNKAGYSLEKQNGDNFYRIYQYLYDDFSPCGGEPTGEWSYDCPGGEDICSYCKREVAEVKFTSSKVTIDSPPSFSVYFFRPPNAGKAILSSDPLEIVLKHTRGFQKKVVVKDAEAVKIYEE